MGMIPQGSAIFDDSFLDQRAPVQQSYKQQVSVFKPS